ncbi:MULTISPECIES: hypothetical protein [Hymenobacter]|uniref:Fibronectin type III domain-containing protein n=1 Tax=Hymenobacter jejuensis TaxID=2502781 RepID=A0A5B8A3V6_9BACT|nr:MULTISPECIES: hypothetical protein [Hymenobacter]MBC6990733.1 hypothetical protein [Hymenobacter sp. BT491]QDA60862.1 hypothetical protein FHG12_12445 [Hymenobacter jejuensis]
MHFTFKLLLVAGLVLASVAMLFGTATVTAFHSKYVGNNVQLEWQVAGEPVVQAYDLYRKTNHESGYIRLASVAPTGQQHYRYLDVGPTIASPVAYRLVVRSVPLDRSYTSVLAKAPRAVQRSWASIKLIFK